MGAVMETRLVGRLPIDEAHLERAASDDVVMTEYFLLHEPVVEEGAVVAEVGDPEALPIPDELAMTRLHGQVVRADDARGIPSEECSGLRQIDRTVTPLH